MELATSLSWKTSLLIGTGVTAALSFGISVWLIFKHLLHYNQPQIQKHIVRIIVMIPIYATDSWLSLIWPHHALYFNVARDMYEAYVLFEFFKYLTDCVDGEDRFAEKLEYVPQMRYSMPLCCFHIKPGRIFLHRCKQMILQYVYVKIGLTIATFILELTGYYAEGNFAVNRGYLWITIIYNLSIFLSLYFLVLFYEGSKEILADFNPLSKFLCIKAVIFFAFWQSVIIAIMSKSHLLITERPGYTEEEISALVNNALICIEMFPIAVAFALTFTWDVYKDPARVPRPANPGMLVNVLKNFGQVANFRDIVLDTQASLRKEPTRRIVTEDFFDIAIEEQKSRIILEGSVKKRGEDLAKIWKTRHVALVSKPAGIMYWTTNPWLHVGTSGETPEIRGFVRFKDIERIAPKRDNEFNVYLNTTRVWRFKCANSAERDYWMQRIQDFLPQADDTVVVSLDGAPEPDAIALSDFDDDESVDFNGSSNLHSSSRTIQSGASVASASATEDDIETSDGEFSDRSYQSDAFVRTEPQPRGPSPPPPRPGVLNFLNRGVRRLSSKVSQVVSPPSLPVPEDSLADARQTEAETAAAQSDDSEDEVSINF